MLAQLLFFLLAIVAVAAALGMLLSRNPVSSALWLVLNLFCIAALYLTLSAQFIAVIQVLVYAGAIMVLFLFVIMLLNAGPESHRGRSWPVKLLGVPLLVLLLGIVSYLIQRMWSTGERVEFGHFTQGGPADIGRLLFSTYILPFEVT